MTKTKTEAALPPLQVNGWSLFAHTLFLDQLDELIAQVEQHRAKDPTGYKQKNATKRLAAIAKLAFDVIPQDPTRAEYRQDTTLGDGYTHWLRAKFFQQYRLFFRYHRDSRIIVCAWVNDEDTKRVYESATDAYQVFRRMLRRGNPPDDWSTLLAQAKTAASRFGKTARKAR